MIHQVTVVNDVADAVDLVTIDVVDEVATDDVAIGEVTADGIDEVTNGVVAADVIDKITNVKVADPMTVDDVDEVAKEKKEEQKKMTPLKWMS